MSIVECNNKRGGRGALVKNTKSCINQLKDYMNGAPVRLVVRNSLSRSQILDES